MTCRVPVSPSPRFVASAVIGVVAYRIVRRLPAELKGKLPDPKQIERLLEAVELPKGEKVADNGEGA